MHGLKMSLQKDLALCDLPSHAEALDKAVKTEWVREQMKSDEKSGDKKRAQQDTRQQRKKEEWINK